VGGGAVEAEEDAVGDGGPGGVLGVAVEAHLVLGLGLETAEDGVLVGVSIEGCRHGWSLLQLPAAKRRTDPMRCLGPLWTGRSGARGEPTGRAGKAGDLAMVEGPTNHRRRRRSI